MAKSSLRVVRGLLRQAGYRVLVRSSLWTECFVQRGAERWEGRGETEAEALDDAVSKMLPSHLSRVLFEEHASRQADKESDAADPEPDAGVRRVPIITVIVEPPDDGAPAPVAMGAPPNAALQPLPVGVDPQTLEAGQPPASEAHAPGEDSGLTAQPVAAQAIPTPTETPRLSAPVAPVDSAPGPQALLETAPAAAAPIVEAASPPLPADTTPVATLMAMADLAPLPPKGAPRLTPANEVPVSRSTLGTTSPDPRSGMSTPVAPHPPSAVVPARIRTAEALDTVEKQLASIEERLAHLARMAGERQRLHMMVWICRARAVEEAHPGVRDVEQAVARVARRLTEIGKMFWPGSVRALQLSARPADVRREMHATWAAEPSNWREATILAERLLDEHLTKSVEQGLDEDGWADAAARTPRPGDPDALFEQVDADIKSILIPPGEVPNGRAGDLSSAEFERLLAAARKLRWLRGGVRDDLAWGIAVGRMRRAVPSLGDRAARVRDVLDHRTKPPVPWAKVLGEAPGDQAAPGVNTEELRAALPEAGTSKEGLLAWLIKAFDALNTPELVDLVVPYRDVLDSFGEDTLNHDDRRVRRRLRELVKRVAAAATKPQTPPPPPKSEPARDLEETIDEPVAEHALAALAARVRAQTQGKKALFVSNREDPELGARLADLLGIDIAWCDGALRRVQAQCERIKGGSYDLVLSATGFQVHGVDSALARAASSAGVPYVRVNRGRPVACVQAIAREFGMRDTGTFHKLPHPAKVSSAD